MIKSQFENFYFYCQSPRDFFHTLCFKRYLENKGFKNFYIVITKDDYSKHYDWSNFLKNFKAIYYVNQCNIGALRGRLNLKGFLFFILLGLRRSFNTKKEFKTIEFKKNSLLISFSGFTLEKTIFMNFSNPKNNIRTFLIADDLNDVNINDFYFSIDGSLYFNLYQFFHGKKYIDLFWYKAKKQTGQRQYKFRKKPTDHFFYGEFLLRNLKLNSDQLYWPILSNDKNNNTGRPKIIIIGGMPYWDKHINIEPFYKKLNKYLELIRSFNKSYDLVYINHPSTDEEKNFEIDRLNLNTFEIIKNVSCEDFAYFNPSEIITFSLFSTTTIILNQIGIQSFTLYRLFNNNEIDERFKKIQDLKWRIENKYGKFHLTNENEIAKVIKSSSKMKKYNLDHKIIKHYNQKLNFL